MIHLEPSSPHKILSVDNLYKFCFVLGAISLLVTSLAAVDRGARSNYFAWVIFLFPVLWVLWILCAWKVRGAYANVKLLSLWIVISLAILGLFVALAARVDSWGHSQGIDAVVMAAYFPVVVPTIYLVYLFPSRIGTAISGIPDHLMQTFGGGIGDAVALWICFSAVAALQCVLLAGIIRLVSKPRNN